MAMASPAEIQKYLSGVDYPADKEDLLEAARSKDAPEEVLDALAQLGEKEYASPAEVMQEIGKVE